MMLVNEYQKKITLLNQANALLNWDEEVNMPHAGINSRSEQAALLSSLAHEKMTSNDFFLAVKKLKNNPQLKGKEKIMVEKLFKDINNSRKIPKELVEEMSRATTLGSLNWRKAREKKDFSIFAPYLEKIVKLKIEYAKKIGAPGHIYNSLLDDFEEGMTAEKLIPVFQKLKAELVMLLKDIENSSEYKKQKLALMKKDFPKEKMEFFLKDMTSRMGMDKEKSRMDISEHPFTTKVGVGDVRITTNYRKDPMFSVGSTVHEAGHALYELGMPEKDAYNVLGDSPSLGLHESQSRFWENMIGKSRHFWSFYFPKFKKEFSLPGTLEDWYKEVNFVQPGKIRIESDEVHYCLHVILRFEIELGLIDGSIKVKDLPKVWNQKLKELFGVTPKDDVEGCLQDVHWSQGYMGYFPTYAIGTIYSAQLYSAMEKEIKNLPQLIGKGDFSKVRLWLNNKVHKHGSTFLADQIIKKATGQGLNPEIYTSYLRQKYSKIYKF